MKCGRIFRCIGIAALLFVSFVMLLLVPSSCHAPQDQDIKPVPTDPSAEGLAVFEEVLAGVYDRVNPSVVNIEVMTEDELFSFEQHGTGSGFVWDEEGHIVTNNHVVSGAGELTVTFHDDFHVPATIVGTDPDSDLAVVNVEVPPEQLYPVELADFDTVQVGHWAIAVGNPFGLQGTMTTGTISAMGRLLPARAVPGREAVYSIPDVIQTDAALNPGNSGGVLANSRGQLIGVPSAIIGGEQGFAGIGFAVPAPIVERVVPALIAEGYYEHSWFGVKVATMHPDLAQAMDLDPRQRGALAVAVEESSPTDKAGLRGGDRTAVVQGREIQVGGDVIIAIDGYPVNNSDDLITYQARHTTPGDIVQVTILRNGEEKTIEVTLGVRP